MVLRSDLVKLISCFSFDKVFEQNCQWFLHHEKPVLIALATLNNGTQIELILVAKYIK
jgi:hypothetical protein